MSETISENDVPKEAKSVINSLCFLYIEDTKTDQLILRRVLEKKLEINFDILTAESAAEGIKIIEQRQFDLIILDYRLPDMTGLEFLGELEKRHISTPVIFVTGKGDEKIAVEAMKRGAHDYIVKDEVNSDRFIDSIKEIALKSELPDGIEPKLVSHIAELFSNVSSIDVEVTEISKIKPESEFPSKEIIPALRKLAESGLLKEEPIRSVVSCPYCGSLNHLLLLQCPECRSQQLTKGDALEHFSCGSVNFRQKFDRGEGNLVCPKCNKRLKQIGVDYRKTIHWYQCSNGHFFGSPLLSYKCSDCAKEFNLDESVLQTVSHYELTERGRHSLKLALIGNNMS